jgi:hypothetical protein
MSEPHSLSAGSFHHVELMAQRQDLKWKVARVRSEFEAQ